MSAHLNLRNVIEETKHEKLVIKRLGESAIPSIKQIVLHKDLPKETTQMPSIVPNKLQLRDQLKQTKSDLNPELTPTIPEKPTHKEESLVMKNPKPKEMRLQNSAPYKKDQLSAENIVIRRRFDQGSLN